MLRIYQLAACDALAPLRALPRCVRARVLRRVIETCRGDVKPAWQKRLKSARCCDVVEILKSRAIHPARTVASAGPRLLCETRRTDQKDALGQGTAHDWYQSSITEFSHARAPAKHQRRHARQFGRGRHLLMGQY
eukprot:6172201-Pleurochrysis_carterae.AAC.1